MSPGPIFGGGHELSGRARWLLPLFLIVLVGLTYWRFQHAPPQTIHVFNGKTMGTTYTVKVATEKLEPELRKKIAAAIIRELQNIESLMSNYDPESELSRFNALGAGIPFAVSLQTLEVFQEAQRVFEMTGGAFDVTVGPLVNLWGFGPGEFKQEIPDPAEVERLRELVGLKHIEINRSMRTLTKKQPGMVCDLSALAKGYGVDRVAEALTALGIENYLVEVGGELRAKGSKLDGKQWRVAVEKPETGRTQAVKLIHLNNLSMATSGDYRNYFEVDGVRYSHTIDPRKAMPVRHNLASVTVFHREAMAADALATALSVLGADEGMTLADKHDLAVLFVVREVNQEFRILESPAFTRTLGREE
ncbi:MAG: FAD:protein FMN transferase [Deltaproteobacteria bacterium]|nr:FAD:protein FMN transferase [Deltaproteobacteria bacterium]